MTRAEELMARVKAEHGHYDYKTGYPSVFEDDDSVFMADGKLLKESVEKGGPYYVADYVKDDELFIFEDLCTFKVRNAEDIENYLKGDKELLEVEDREIVWC